MQKEFVQISKLVQSTYTNNYNTVYRNNILSLIFLNYLRIFGGCMILAVVNRAFLLQETFDST